MFCSLLFICSLIANIPSHHFSTYQSGASRWVWLAFCGWICPLAVIAMEPSSQAALLPEVHPAHEEAVRRNTCDVIRAASEFVAEYQKGPVRSRRGRNTREGRQAAKVGRACFNLNAPSVCDNTPVRRRSSLLAQLPFEPLHPHRGYEIVRPVVHHHPFHLPRLHQLAQP